MRTSAEIDTKKPLILIADDDEGCLDVLFKMLTALGYDVFAVHDGKSAIEAFQSKRNQINLVILDMKMPYNGEKTYTKLRKIDKQVRILLIRSIPSIPKQPPHPHTPDTSSGSASCQD